ncbi:uncharacterized protein [Procambarus clarkii]|nr:uncharacterized protein LOC123746277 isoform X2 [Procambarus clarkii]
MESSANPLVSYTSPADSPAVSDHFSQNTLHQLSPNSSNEQNRLSSRSDSGLLDISEESSVNPSLPPELEESECAVLRGDAIGNTTYTHRWVLNTLLKITQALPQYLMSEKPDEETMSTCTEAANDEVSMLTSEIQPDEEDTTKKNDSILELAEDVENAACQLWDMTAEPDVVHYLLSLSVVDILHLAKDVITLSRAPRLTEVVVGVVANLCCQAVGCEKVIGHHSLLNSCLTLLHTTDDVPTLIEAFRLLRLLLWHLTYRVAPQDRALNPVILALKNHESLKETLVFMLKNSLSDLFLSALSQFLEALMYIWLPDDKCYMAAYYSESGLVEGVVEVMRHFLKEWKKSGSQEQPVVVHQGILILYSFVATPAAHIISSFDQYESLLEPILVSYVEHLAKVENVEVLLDGENAERLTYALGLYELLVPTMRHPNILLTVGKLLALTHGASHHYTAIQNQTLQEAGIQDKDKIHSLKMRRRSKSRRSRSSSGEIMETEFPGAMKKKERESEQEVIVSSVSTKETECKEVTQSTSQNLKSVNLVDSTNPSENCERALFEKNADKEIKSSSSSLDLWIWNKFIYKDVPDKKKRSAKLKNTVESLTDYCVRVVRCCPDLCAVLTALNECHVHEVQLFFRAVRSREPKLVGQLQEQLLDTGSHNRLVTILSDMYT